MSNNNHSDDEEMFVMFINLTLACEQNSSIKSGNRVSLKIIKSLRISI